MARPLLSVFLWGGGKRVWSGLVYSRYSSWHPPTVVGGVNGGNVICYCLIVTRAISVVLYKRVSSYIKNLWDRQKAEFQFQSTISKWSILYEHFVCEAASFLTLETVQNEKSTSSTMHP